MSPHIPLDFTTSKLVNRRFYPDISRLIRWAQNAFPNANQLQIDIHILSPHSAVFVLTTTTTTAFASNGGIVMFG